MRNTRDSHAALNGVAIPEDEKFRTIWGNELRYPGDPSAPAAEIINCHCVLIPGVLMPGENADARLKNAPKSDIIKGEERVETAPEKAAAIEKEFRYTDAWGDAFSPIDRASFAAMPTDAQEQAAAGIRKAKELIEEGAIGEMKRMNWIVTDWYRTQFYYDSGAWRATWAGEGGGVLLNQCPHQLDLLQWLCGLPARVHAFTHEGKWHDIEVEDDVTAYLEFANGATGVFVTTTGDAPGTNRLEITGTKGRLIVENNELIFDKLEMDEREWCVTCPEGFKKPGVTRVPVETDGQNLQHVAVLNAFADHIEHGGPLVADGREGINGLMLSNAIHLSGWTGETVYLPIDEEKFLQLLNERRATSRHKEDVDVVMDTSSSYGSKVSK